VSCTVSPSSGAEVGLVTVTLAVTLPDSAVASNVTGTSPATVAVARLLPAAVPSVQRVLALPALSVLPLVGFTVPPPAVTA
jgi:hypothetical protein